jgi:hypothetical protein
MAKQLFRKLTVSLLFPKKIIVSLGSDYLALAETKGRRLKSWRIEHFSLLDKNNLDSILPKLQTWLSELAHQKIDLALRLSTDLAPICLLPWRNEITNPEQQALIAEAHFKNIYGNEANQWKVSVNSPDFGEAWVASGVAVETLENINVQLSSDGANITSIAPLSISIFNDIRNDIKASHGWLLIPEFKNLVAIYLIDGQWRLIQTLLLSDLQGESLSEILKREARLAGFAEHPFQIYSLGALPVNANTIKLSLGWDISPTISAQQPTYLVGGVK